MPHPPKKSKNLKKREYENETNAEASHFYGSIHVTTEVSSGCWQLVVDEQNFPTFPPKKKKSGKTIPPPTTHFSWASFSSTSPLCIENAVIVASCLHALCSHVHHITSHRIGYPGLPIFFLYHHAAPPKPFHKCLLRVPKLHSRSLSHPLSPSRSPLTSVVEWANFLAYECVCFVFHHYIFFLTFFPIFAIFFCVYFASFFYALHLAGFVLFGVQLCS